MVTNSREDSSEQHDSVLQTKTGPVAANQERAVSIEGRRVVAGRYAILGALGRGGMGEVWHAFDLKLRVDVALKSLRSDRVQQDVEVLRREVRTAREVISPNVCRIFDLVVEDQQELVSMEYIDGITLAELLQKNNPLELQKAADIASQFLAGLQAIHQAGLVHRDFKPENVMITRTGRVVVMDFGIAKPVAQFNETISGTPSYMAPEQLEGRKLDPRSDLFAAGVVLAEMIHPQGVSSRESREAILAAMRQDPSQLPEGPWKKIIARAVSKNADDRFPSANALARALEEVSQRLQTAEDRKPYPGLSAFTETDAEFFFGRELEVEAVLKKLQQLHLMAIIGPSGAGKTSFLHAGLIPSLPEDWSYIICQPGDSPIPNLAHALVDEFSGDKDAMHKMLRFEEIDVALSLLGQWRQKHSQVVLIVDRFEEVFTLNEHQIQSQFAELLGRASLEADVRILFAMRDDFLFFCHQYSHLAPIFSELTPIGPLSDLALNRALVQPAQKCGYRFQDDALAKEIVADVEKERGALPLIAFAAACLWEKRDRELGILARQSYQEIGGVAGALAQHAEKTMAKIGNERQEIVREIFRNLITAQGTRTARDIDELLSVFPNHKEAEEVLRILVDARLLTSFDVKPEGKSRIEIIHESLLSAWPRLVRWQTQDADSAQLHDQLRQAAHLWKERGKPSDLLWTGSSYKEFEVWRERYTGGLTATEEEFAHAITTNAGRYRRNRRLAVVTLFVLLLGILAIISNFWRRETAARQRADDSVKHAEASKLLALGRLELDDYPTAALAYAMASLELRDTPEARRFALETLWRGPTATIIPTKEILKDYDLAYLNFSPNGKWLATESSTELYLWPQDGSSPWKPQAGLGFAFSSKPEHLITGGFEKPIQIWSLDERKLLRQVDSMYGIPVVKGDRILAFTFSDDGWSQISRLNDSEAKPETLGKFYYKEDLSRDIDPTGTWMANGKGSDVFMSLLKDPQRSQLAGSHSNKIHQVLFDRNGNRLASIDEAGEIRIWSFNQGSIQLSRILKAPRPARFSFLQWSRSDRKLAIGNANEQTIRIWDFSGPPEAEPLALRIGNNFIGDVDFHSTDQWIASAQYDRISMWPLSKQYARVMRGHTDRVRSIAFVGNNRVVTGGYDGTVRLWPLSSDSEVESRVLVRNAGLVRGLSVNQSGNYIVAGGTEGMFLIPLTFGQIAVQLTPRPIQGVAFSPDGKFVAGAPHGSQRGDMFLRIWDVNSHEVIKSFALRQNMNSTNFEEGGVDQIRYLSDSQLITAGHGGVRLWNLKDGSNEFLLSSKTWMGITVSNDARNMVARELEGGIPILFNMTNRSSHLLTTHGRGRGNAIGLDPTGNIIATGGSDGIIRVGSLQGEEPHLLYGHKGEVASLAVSPDGNWIASGGADSTVQLWSMPKGKPFHTLPYDEFVSRLHALTNVRFVKDQKSQNGYRITFEKFPGWEKVPTW